MLILSKLVMKVQKKYMDFLKPWIDTLSFATVKINLNFYIWGISLRGFTPGVLPLGYYDKGFYPWGISPRDFTPSGFTPGVFP